MRLKSWESPRSGRQRNTKSKQASARIKQLKKRTQQLRQKLKKTPDSRSGVFICQYGAILSMAYPSMTLALGQINRLL